MGFIIDKIIMLLLPFKIIITIRDRYPEWAKFRMTQCILYNIPNGLDSEWTQSRMNMIPNGHDPEWT